MLGITHDMVTASSRFSIDSLHKNNLPSIKDSKINNLELIG